MNSPNPCRESLKRLLLSVVAVSAVSFAVQASDPSEALKKLLVGTSALDERIIDDVKTMAYSANLMVVVTSQEGMSGELRMYRLPLGTDPRPIAAVETSGLIDGIRLRDLVGSVASEILLDFHGSKNQRFEIFTWQEQEFVRIAQYAAYGEEGFLDLDHDGILEILGSGCCSASICGFAVHISTELYRFNGQEYKWLEDVVAFQGFEMLDGSDQVAKVELNLLKREVGLNEYVLEVVNGDRDSSTRVTGSISIDGLAVVSPDRLNTHRATVSDRLRLDPSECHTLTAHIEGSEAGKMFVLIREVTVK